MLEPMLGQRSLFMFFILASFVAAWQGGVWPGIFTACLGFVVADYCFIEPRWSFYPLLKADWTHWVSYFGVTGTAIVLLEALHRANHRAENATLLAERRGEQLRSGMDEIRRLNAELEQRVRDRTAELELVNKELESFSFSVSHDLRAPLRSITGFTGAVLEDYRDKLDENGVKYLQYAADAGRRMSALIEDLMNLSRVTRAEIHREDVDLSALASHIVADLRKQEPQRSVEIRIADNLVTEGDEGLLRIALENLIRNAWKFTSQTPCAIIELGSTLENGTVRFFLRDNGAGFDMAHASRLFGAFQRMHSIQEFPGTGVGLATVKRIFNRHGGQIWAGAKVNEGATFYFTLPGAPASPSRAPMGPVGAEHQKAHLIAG